MRRAAGALALLVAVSCSAGTGEPSAPPVRTGEVAASADPASRFFPSERVQVRFDEGAEVRAEVAVTIAQLARGLMHREELGADDGMLFLFQKLHTDGFYMKNTLIPLSIAFMRRTTNRTYRVVAIRDMQPCPAETVTCPTYPSDAPYDAALEVNLGWFERNAVGVGATASVDGPIPNPFDQAFPTR